LRHKFEESIFGFVRTTLAILSILFLSACSRDDPGPLAGTWRMAGAVPVTVHFRSGETETMGVIEKVSYEVNGNVVTARYRSGLMKGAAARYVLTGPDTARFDIVVLRRIR
jgi:hypothetical protein